MMQPASRLTGLLRDVGGNVGKRKKNYSRGGRLLSSTRHGKGPCVKGSAPRELVHTQIHTSEGFLPVTQVSGSWENGRW